MLQGMCSLKCKSEAMQIEQEKTRREQIEIEGRKDLQRMASGVQKVKTDF